MAPPQMESCSVMRSGSARCTAGFVEGEIVRYALPRLGALNFVMRRALAGGVATPLSVDPHGKRRSSLMLALQITVVDDDYQPPRPYPGVLSGGRTQASIRLVLLRHSAAPALPNRRPSRYTTLPLTTVAYGQACAS